MKLVNRSCSYLILSICLVAGFTGLAHAESFTRPTEFVVSSDSESGLTQAQKRKITATYRRFQKCIAKSDSLGNGKLKRKAIKACLKKLSPEM